MGYEGLTLKGVIKKQFPQLKDHDFVVWRPQGYGLNQFKLKLKYGGTLSKVEYVIDLASLTLVQGSLK